jgi:hypothetical protein
MDVTAIVSSSIQLYYSLALNREEALLVLLSPLLSSLPFSVPVDDSDSTDDGER